jgi:hypothetical protein
MKVFIFVFALVFYVFAEYNDVAFLRIAEQVV